MFCPFELFKKKNSFYIIMYKPDDEHCVFTLRVLDSLRRLLSGTRNIGAGKRRVPSAATDRRPSAEVWCPRRWTPAEANRWASVAAGTCRWPAFQQPVPVLMTSCPCEVSSRRVGCRRDWANLQSRMATSATASWASRATATRWSRRRLLRRPPAAAPLSSSSCTCCDGSGTKFSPAKKKKINEKLLKVFYFFL